MIIITKYDWVPHYAGERESRGVGKIDPPPKQNNRSKNGAPAVPGEPGSAGHVS